MTSKNFDICIIGAGIAGASLAAYLGRRGHNVALFEKEWQAPDRIVGELIQPDGVQKLQSLGLQHTIENIDAQKVNGYAIFLNGEHIAIPYSNENGYQEGFGLRNQNFLQNLRTEIEKHQSVEIIKSNVTDLCIENNRVIGCQYTDENGTQKTITAKLNVISDGFFSKLRNQLHGSKATVTGYFLGAILENVELPFANHGHVFVGEKVKFLAYPITSTKVRMLIELKDTSMSIKSQELKLWLKENVRPQLPESMFEAFDTAVQKADFKIMPNHLLHADAKVKEGAVMLGDSLNMRNPLTGGGMTVALTDVKNLCELIDNLENFETNTIDKLIDKFYEKHACNATINILADALQRVFSDPELAVSCFNYLKKGGKNASEPVSLLAGLVRNQSTLLQHFFAVALDGATSKVKEKGVLLGSKDASKMMYNATKIVSPLVLNENKNSITNPIKKLVEKI